MSELPHWPDAGNFISDFDVRLACAERVVELLATYGSKQSAHFGNKEVAVMRTRAVDALEERDDRYQDALRVSECLYIHTNDRVMAGQPLEVKSINDNDDMDYRAFALEFGTVDLDAVDQEEPIEPEIDYNWRSLALVVVALNNDELLDSENIMLLDADTGSELNDERGLKLYSLIQAVGNELRSMEFSNTGLFDEIAKPELEQDGEDKFGRAFVASEFIQGVDCDECLSEHIACSHNHMLN